jgi:chitin-binding protein
VTRDGWSPSQPLRWGDVDPFCARGPVPLDIDAQGRSVYRLACDLPDRSGRHVIFATWQRADSPEAFYSCSDVEFTGGTDGGWRLIGAVRAPTALGVGTVVSFRLFDDAGRDLERIDLTLARGQTSRRLWPYALAREVNARSSLARIGVLAASGEVVPTKAPNRNLVYARSDRIVRFQIDVAKPGGGASHPTYPEGIGRYGPGSVVRGSDGLLYECRPFPFSGWCNQAPDFYAPGSGSDWSDAWPRR